MRWRTEREVINGKGQFVCGHKSCECAQQLTSWEVNFAYQEHNQKKNALVKIRKFESHHHDRLLSTINSLSLIQTGLCPDCAIKLNYRSQKSKIDASISDDYRSDQAQTVDQTLNQLFD